MIGVTTNLALFSPVCFAFNASATLDAVNILCSVSKSPRHQHSNRRASERDVAQHFQFRRRKRISIDKNVIAFCRNEKQEKEFFLRGINEYDMARARSYVLSFAIEIYCSATQICIPWAPSVFCVMMSYVTCIVLYEIMRKHRMPVVLYLGTGCFLGY